MNSGAEEENLQSSGSRNVYLTLTIDSNYEEEAILTLYGFKTQKLYKTFTTIDI